jgi:putative ABC transport system ATP-binding protein
MTPAWVEVRGLVKNYGYGSTMVRALRGIDLDIGRGEFVGLVGPSGSGKSTFLNILGCLDRPTSGSVRIHDLDLFGQTAGEMARYRARFVGFIFQDFNLFGVLSAYENAEYPLLLTRTAASERRRRVTEMLERVGLGDKLHRRPGELSGGEKQRVAIARALVHRPRIVLADEPTANLDSETGERIVALLSELNRELETTFIICTHDRGLLDRVQRVFTIRDGRLQDPLP